MIELRKDYVLDRWSYIALGRGKRPQETEITSSNSADSACYFCPGNENLTPPEIGRIADGEKWQVRWFANKFPAVEPELKSVADAEGDNRLVRAAGFGYHEVIAETPDHAKQLASLSALEIRDVLRTYAGRIQELGARSGINYVQVFKNSGAPAGTSIAHSHSQIVASALVPRAVQEKVAAVKTFDHCPYCQIVSQEEQSERLVFANENFVAFTAFAPRFNYEVMVLPKKHHRSLTEISETEFDDLAEVMQKVLSKLGKINAPYNFYLHYAPAGEDLHFHFEITPRLNTWAGFELATESFVITTSPEEAAAFYRE